MSPIAANQCVGRAVVTQNRLSFAIELGNDLLCKYLAEFNSPLVERVDVPNDALNENRVLVQGNELAQRFRRQPFRENHVGWTVARKYAVRHQPIRRTFGLHLLGRLAKSEGFGLGEGVCKENVVVSAKIVQALE